MAWRQEEQGVGGWVRVNDPELPGHLYVRFAPDERGRLRPVDLFLEGSDEPITAAHLRAVPLADIEASTNGEEDSDLIRSRLGQAAPDLRTLAGSFGSFLGISGHEIERAASAAEARGRQDWVTLSHLSQYGDDYLRGAGVIGEDEHTMPRPRKSKPRERLAPPAYDLTVPRARISRPPGRSLPDEFLIEVAHAYSSLAKDGQKPAPVIAEEAGVPVTTVHRWIKESRRRGLLAPARKGATG